jgi:hypothetical protein
MRPDPVHQKGQRGQPATGFERSVTFPVRHAFEAAGVELIDENADAPILNRKEQPSKIMCLCPPTLKPPPCSDEKISKQSRRQHTGCAVQGRKKIGMEIRWNSLQGLQQRREGHEGSSDHERPPKRGRTSM